VTLGFWLVAVFVDGRELRQTQKPRAETDASSHTHTTRDTIYYSKEKEKTPHATRHTPPPPPQASLLPLLKAFKRF
jgi:hypothetical protein